MKKLFLIPLLFLSGRCFGASCAGFTDLQYTNAIYNQMIATLSESELDGAKSFEDVMIRKVKKAIDGGGAPKNAAICFGVDFYNSTYNLNVSSTSHSIRHWYKEKTGSDFQ